MAVWFSSLLRLTELTSRCETLLSRVSMLIHRRQLDSLSRVLSIELQDPEASSCQLPEEIRGPSRVEGVCFRCMGLLLPSLREYEPLLPARLSQMLLSKSAACFFSQLDILCNEEILGKDHTLKFVVVTRWRFKVSDGLKPRHCDVALKRLILKVFT